MKRRDRKTFQEILDAVAADARELRGSAKLRAALDGFGVAVANRVCLDVGASTGGFVAVLLERGARCVYAVDAGFGQLLGSLRADDRVVNLERTNIADLTTQLVPEPIDVVTVDVSYLSLREAVAQLAPVEFSSGADLVGLVKPMFELRLADAPMDAATLGEAITVATTGVAAAGWDVVKTLRSNITGAGGAIEGFVHAKPSKHP
jgi:23S rRNA (cytidine1920-2'-O)/16S rRNA (cytidine1409-2'-O)-methyltransferase